VQHKGVLFVTPYDAKCMSIANMGTSGTSRVPRRERRSAAIADTSSHVHEHSDDPADPGDGVEHVASASSTASSCCLDEPTSADAAVKAFLARILGWERRCAVAVERAQRSIKLATSDMLRSSSAVMGISCRSQRRSTGVRSDLRPPFIVCDLRRGNARATARSPANRATGTEAIAAARGGTICMCARRLPHDFAAVIDRVRDPAARVQTVVCWGQLDQRHPLLVVPAPIIVPSIRERAAGPSRIVEEYAVDAVATLSARAECFTVGDRAWIVEHASRFLDEIDKATLRIVAMRTSRNLSDAAARLNMASVSLSRWFARRPRLPPRLQPPNV
jgi:hypothetical protein